MTLREDWIRRIIAVSLCWMPLLVLFVSVVTSWETATGAITTQWNDAGPSTQAPAWTALILPGSVCIVTGVIATTASIGSAARDQRVTYLLCCGVACAALWIWFVLVSANTAPLDTSMPNQILLFPFFVLLGFIPWAVAGRRRRVADEQQDRLSRR